MAWQPLFIVDVNCLLTFVSGAAVEAVCALWVKAVAEHRALRSGLLSMVWAVALLAGIGEAIKHGWPAVTWVLGYGVGSWAAVKMGGTKP